MPYRRLTRPWPWVFPPLCQYFQNYLKKIRKYISFADWYQRRVSKFWAPRKLRNSRKNSDLLNSTWIKYLAFDTTEECLDWSNLLDKLIVQRKSQIQIKRSVSVALHGGSGLPVKVILHKIISFYSKRANNPRTKLNQRPKSRKKNIQQWDSAYTSVIESPFCAWSSPLCRALVTVIFRDLF